MPDQETISKLKSLITKQVEEARVKAFEQDRKQLTLTIGKDLIRVIQPLIKQIGNDLKEAVQPLAEITLDLVKESRLTKEEIKEAIAEASFNIPEIKVPKPEVTVTVPEVKVPKTEIKMPDSMKVDGEMSLRGVNRDNALPVTLFDLDGQPVDLFSELQVIAGSGGGGFRNVIIGKMESSSWGSLLTPDGRLKTEVATGGSGLTDTELRASAVPVSQVSGASWSTTSNSNDGVDIGNVDIASAINTLDVKQVSGANWSVEVATQPITFDVRQLSGAINSTNVVQLAGTAIAVDSGVTGAGVQRIVHVTDVAMSVRGIANSGVDIGDVDVLSIAAGDNNIGDVDVRQVSGAVDSVNVIQLAGTAIAADSGVTGAGVQRIVHVTDIGLSAQATGDIASDGVDSGNPVKVGFQARTTNPTKVADADRVNAVADTMGRQVNWPIQVRDLIFTAYATLNTNTETTLLAATAGVYHDLIYVAFANTSAGAIAVDLRAVLAGNITSTINCPAEATQGFSLPVPMPQSDTGNAWTVDFNDADITNTTVYVQALFARNT